MASPDWALGGEGRGGALGAAVWRIKMELKKTIVSTPDSPCPPPTLPHPTLNWRITVSVVAPRPGMSASLLGVPSLTHLHGVLTAGGCGSIPAENRKRLSGLGAVFFPGRPELCSLALL